MNPILAHYAFIFFFCGLIGAFSAHIGILWWENPLAYCLINIPGVIVVVALAHLIFPIK